MSLDRVPSIPGQDHHILGIGHDPFDVSEDESIEVAPTFEDAIDEIQRQVTHHIDLLERTLPARTMDAGLELSHLVRELDRIEERYDGDRWEMLARIAAVAIAYGAATGIGGSK